LPHEETRCKDGLSLNGTGRYEQLCFSPRRSRESVKSDDQVQSRLRTVPELEDQRLARVLQGFIALALGYVSYRAVACNLEYYDSYVYLGSASWLAGHQGVAYTAIRPPLLAILQSPVVAVARHFGVANPTLLVAPRLVSALMSALTCVAVFFA